MRKLLLAIALLTLGVSFASAQTITKSLQGAQDPRGPVGLDANNNAYFPNHVNAYGNLGSVPTLASGGDTFLGTPSDNAGIVVIPVSVTTMTLTFGQAFGAVPACILQEQAGTVAPTFTVATTGILATVVASSKNYDFICIGQQ